MKSPTSNNQQLSDVRLIENRPNFQSLSEIAKAEKTRRANGSTSAMANFQST